MGAHQATVMFSPGGVEEPAAEEGEGTAVGHGTVDDDDVVWLWSGAHEVGHEVVWLPINDA